MADLTGGRADVAGVSTLSGSFYEVGAIEPPFFEQIVHQTGSAGGGGTTEIDVRTYRMRGFDQNGAVNDTVFWDSNKVDSNADDYAGSAGPVVNIVVWKIIGG